MRLSKATSSKLLCVIIFIWAPILIAKPVVIAHRGASGYLPEHTIAAYAKAIDMGADYIEPDLMITRDGELIARHDHYLSTTTDVAEHEVFADRRKTIDGREDWYTEDFTLAEIRTLLARQPFPGRSRAHDDRYGIPTLQEVIDLAKEKSVETGRAIGIYPEAKIPEYFESLGFDFAGLLLEVLEANELVRPNSPVFVQSFSPGILERMNGMTDVRLVQLINSVSSSRPNEPNIPLERIAAYADGVGASKALLIDENGRSSGVIGAAHDLGLFVHAWTFRDDAYPNTYFSSARAEIAHFLELGLDGFFTDFPDTGVSVRDRYWADRRSGNGGTH